VVVLFLVCPRELVSFFLYRGKFEQAWLQPAARTLFCFGCALPGVALYILSGQVLVVKKKVTVYAALGVLTQLLPVGLNLAGYQRYGLPFFAVSWGLAHACSGLLMSVIGGIWERKQLLGLLRLCGVLVFSLAACRLFYQYVQALSPLMVLISVMLCCGLSVLLFLYLFRMRELDTLKRKLKPVFHSPEHE
jgi:peptidoglycan biosynthesis protein MviN/MurJ (putative lipid II flippase)